MSESSFVRRAVLAGTLALSLTGVTGGIESARAMPVAAPSAPATGPGAVTLAQYYGYPRYRYRRFYGHRRAGIYDCGPGSLRTRLSRKACR